jgi:hypothetical protein
MAKYQSKEWRENISRGLKKSYIKGRKRVKYWSGKKFSKKHKIRISKGCKGINLGSKHGLWKGDEVGLKSLHKWVKARIPKPKLCSRCHKRKAIDLANKSGKYKRDLSDWNWLCRHCHMVEDGRIENLNQYSKNVAWNKGKKFNGHPSLKSYKGEKL